MGALHGAAVFAAQDAKVEPATPGADQDSRLAAQRLCVLPRHAHQGRPRRAQTEQRIYALNAWRRSVFHRTGACRTGVDRGRDAGPRLEHAPDAVNRCGGGGLRRGPDRGADLGGHRHQRVQPDRDRDPYGAGCPSAGPEEKLNSGTRAREGAPGRIEFVPALLFGRRSFFGFCALEFSRRQRFHDNVVQPLPPFRGAHGRRRADGRAVQVVTGRIPAARSRATPHGRRARPRSVRGGRHGSRTGGPAPG